MPETWKVKTSGVSGKLTGSIYKMFYTTNYYKIARNFYLTLANPALAD